MKKIFISMALVILGLQFGHAQEKVSLPNAHAPLGVMGDHAHNKGEWMVSYRYMHMTMDGNRNGTDDLDDSFIATTVPNRFSGMDMMPPTLRVVPQDMTMDMHMLGVMYAPTDKLTLMAMVPYVVRDMTLTTYQGGMGSEVLGNFNTSSSGLGDVKISGIYKITSAFRGTLGVSIPTGSVEETDEVLTPMNMRNEMRLPYAMQNGTGTWDLLPGLTYSKSSEQTGYGVQAKAILPLADNSEGYKRGNRVEATAWGSYNIKRWVSFSLRAQYAHEADIDGIDDEIMAPVQTANPDYYGGSWINGFTGLNFIGQSGIVKNHRLAVEWGAPFYQDLNGPQMKAKSTLIIGWQYAF
ncbi:hypothetical protein LVD15_19490 [Fulvivirga maritima]|uniref:transporter n=1 Tax=Fulvivirga maritima TaxID=2904247 RepID=UPI001F39D831|nr:transporter [Fulvivirga maritima]UII25469.1 hypothetical protein LVD15_19490 [Fulvivirga maritima]